MSELPKGWVETVIGQVIRPFETVDPTARPEAEFIYVDIGSIDNRTQSIVDPKRFLGRDAPSRARRVIKEGDILFSTVRTYLKNIARVPLELEGALTSTGIAVLRPSGCVESNYLFRWVCSDEFIRAMSNKQDGTLYPAVTDKDVASGAIRLPPLREQERIMAKVDALTSCVTRAHAQLDRVPVLIARYKQRLLALAFSGRLTAEWRESNPHGGRIVGRRSSEIRSKFAIEAEGAFRPPYELPEHWSWLRLPELGDLDRGKSRHRPRNDPKLFGGKYPFIQTGDVRSAQRFLTEYTTTYSEFGLSQSKLWPVGTVCITIAANIAETAILGIEACFPDSVVGFLADADRVSGEYIEYFIRTLRSDLEAFAPATAQKNINLDVLSAVRVPTPPLDEQAEILRRINSAFGWLDSVAANHDVAARLLPKLDSSILTKAFRGELVPQDPNDVPAGVALEQGSAGQPGAPKRGRGRTAKTRGPLDSLAAAPPPNAALPTTHVAVPAVPKDFVMSKSRQDPDVMGQPYLAKILRKQSGGGSVDALFKAADLPVADFYKQLAWEIEHQYILNKQDRLEVA